MYDSQNKPYTFTHAPTGIVKSPIRIYSTVLISDMAIDLSVVH
jgi:hypothetical protein